MDFFVEGYKSPKIQYIVFNSKTNEKLDLSLCENKKINIIIPVSIDENNLDKYNPKSSYYNDLCNTYSTEEGTDITLKDRKAEFIENNMTLCEEECEFLRYDTNTKEAQCECPVKINILKIIFLIIFYFISILFFKKDMKIIEMTIKQIVYTKNVMNKKNQKKNKYKKK